MNNEPKWGFIDWSSLIVGVIVLIIVLVLL